MKTTFIIIVIFIVIIVLSLLQFLDECFVASLFFVDSRLPSNEKTCLRLSEKTDYGFGFHGLGFSAL